LLTKDGTQKNEGGGDELALPRRDLYLAGNTCKEASYSKLGRGNGREAGGGRKHMAFLLEGVVVRKTDTMGNRGGEQLRGDKHVPLL